MYSEKIECHYNEGATFKFTTKLFTLNNIIYLNNIYNKTNIAPTLKKNYEMSMNLYI